MIVKEYEHGFKDTWNDVLVKSKEGYYTSVSDFHEHEFYEVNLILSGNVNILLKDQAEHGTSHYLVLTSPGTPHYISCQPDTLYSRLYLMFSHSFIANSILESESLLSIFGKHGNILRINNSQKELCQKLIRQIHAEKKLFRKQLLTLYLLSTLAEFQQNNPLQPAKIPAYIMEALSYIDSNFNQKIVADCLAKHLYVSRTTLMTGFKKYTGETLNGYILNYRLKNAIKALQMGKTEQETAEICGFHDSSALIRAFKKMYRMTPKQYINTFSAQL